MISKKLEQRLRELCETVQFRSRHSAAVVRSGKVLAYGVNRDKTHTANLDWGKNPDAIYLHAEIDAIVRAINRRGEEVVKGSTLVVCRLTRDGQLSNSCPCDGCKKAIKDLDLTVIHSTLGGWTNG